MRKDPIRKLKKIEADWTEKTVISENDLVYLFTEFRRMRRAILKFNRMKAKIDELYPEWNK